MKNSILFISLLTALIFSSCKNYDSGPKIAKTFDVSEFSIYPNPTSGLITVNLGSSNNSVSYTITTIDGKIVETGKTSNNLIDIDLGNESKGVYFINIHQEGSENVFKVVKQ